MKTAIDKKGGNVGLQEEARALVSPQITERVSALSVTQLDSLAEALLDFESSSDLDNWLRSLSE